MKSIDLICRQVLMSAYLYYLRGESVLTDAENDSNVKYLADNWDKIPLEYLALLDYDSAGSTGLMTSTYGCRYSRMVEGGAIAWLEANGGGTLKRLKRGYLDGIEIENFIKWRTNMPDVNIYQLIDVSQIIPKAFEHPAVRIKPRSKSRPTIDTALKAVIAEIEHQVVAHISAEVFEVLEEKYGAFVFLDGDYEDLATTQERDAWESAVDDLVEEAIEPYVPHLSQDWLGKNTIATSLHIDNGVKQFSDRLAIEYFKQITYGKTPPQVMSNANITQADVEAALAIHNNPTQQELTTMADNQNDALQDIAERLAHNLGKDFDAMLVYDDLDQASDDDDGLSEGAIARLGLEVEDIETLRNERLMNGDEFIEPLMQKMEELTLKSKKSTTAKQRTVKEKPAAQDRAQPSSLPEAAQMAVGVVPTQTLQALKSCGVGDTEMGKQLGVSRATYNNYVNGKSAFTANDAQRDIIRGDIVERLNNLHEALALLDNAEAHVVF